MLLKITILYTVMVNLVQCLHLAQPLSPKITTITNYPRKITYIDKIESWWPASKIAESLAVPGYAKSNMYNYVILAFWTCSNGPLDALTIWNDPIKYFGDNSQFGNTKQLIQTKLRQLYNQKGIKIMVSAFGATQFPSTARLDPEECATKLGNFAINNNIDGVDIDWQDNPAMELGIGQQWLIKFTYKLRLLIPDHIISHAPQAPYFKQEYYKNGGYVKVNNQVGSLIDFYNVQFYNQGDSKYETCQALFTKSDGLFSGTSVLQISKRGIPLNKIVVGKPATPNDATNTGYMTAKDLGSCTSIAFFSYNWHAGVMYWQYLSDKKGKSIKQAIAMVEIFCMIGMGCF